jgi:NAD(P)-dependent dehydrogenase (short-subunit alcohol dehydrogenase family)
VLVNDPGVATHGVATDEHASDDAAEEIRADGGIAVADRNSVIGDGAAVIVEHALDEFGRVDIVVNNAGIMRWAGFPEVDAESLAAHLAVHVGGSFHTTRAAWPHLVERGYGRVVMTTSTGLLGLPENLPYATAKAGVIGMARSLNTAGAAHGIKVNLIAPAAATRMAGQTTESPEMASDLVSPMVAYLAHEDCPVSGEVYVAGGGRFNRLFIATTPGYVHGEGAPTVEDVAEHWAAINDEAGYLVPTDLMDWTGDFLAHLPPS